MDQPRLARDIMVSDVMTARPHEHACDGLNRLLRYNISGIPVVDEQRKYLGVFSEKCCMSLLTLAEQKVSAGQGIHPKSILARNFMAMELVTLSPRMDVVEAIGLLLKHHVSGAPVLDESGEFLGVLSERYSMRYLIDAAYDQLPTSEVAPFMNTDFGRVISENTNLTEIVDIFHRQIYRRLIVLRDGKLLGQISRRDALRAGQYLAAMLQATKPIPSRSSDRAEQGDDRSDATEGRLPSLEIAAFMDTNARTITEELDLLSIAQIFLSSNYRRLPVLRDGKLMGQVSRRDVLQTTYDLMDVTPQRAASLLYLSSLMDRGDAPIS